MTKSMRRICLAITSLLTIALVRARVIPDPPPYFPLESRASFINDSGTWPHNPLCGNPAYPGNFTCVTCSEPTISDRTSFAIDRWTAAGGDAAWDSIKKYWVQSIRPYPGKLGAVQGFVPTLSYAWNGPEGVANCSLLDVRCEQFTTCEQTNIPAGAMILNSFANIHTFYKNMHQAIQNARGSMTNQIGPFAKVFAPQKKKTVDLLRIFMDLFGLSYGLIGAAVWNKMLRNTAMFRGSSDDHSWAKDSANAAVASSVLFAKDSQPGIQGQVDTKDDIESMLGVIVDGWAQVTSDWVDHLFSGTDAGLQDLDSHVRGGAWSDTSDEIPKYPLQTTMQQILYGKLIPAAWSDHKEVHPVIVYNENASAPYPQSVYNVTLGQEYFVDAKDKTLLGGKTFLNNQPFWLLDAHDCERRGRSMNVASGCSDPVVQLLPGTAALGPNSSWGNITIEDIVSSAWGGFLLNGRQNGYQASNTSLFSVSATNSDVFQGGIRTPGFFTIPVCNFTRVIDNVQNWRMGGPAAHCPNYPCCTNLPKVS